MLRLRAAGVLLVVAASLTRQAEAAECPSPPDSELNRLHLKLLCGYDRNVRPTTDANVAVKVMARMWLQRLEFNSYDNRLAIHSFMSWGWNDQYLKWNPADYNGLQRIEMSSADIWMPDIGLTVPMDYASQSNAIGADVMCRVSSTGDVQCFTPTVYPAPCVADTTRWPFDSHTCNAYIASSTLGVDKIDFTFAEVEKTDYVENRNWELLGVATSKRPGTHPTYQVSFTLRRHSGGASSTVVVPAGVLATLTLVSFLLDAEAKERLLIIGLNILCHCLFLHYLGINLPSNGENIPIILVFFRDSLLLAGVSLVLSLLIRRMLNASCPPPAWAAALASGVLDTLPGQVLLCGHDKDAAPRDNVEDADPLVGKTSSSSTWRLLGTLLDRVAFLIFFLTLFILLCVTLP